MRAAIAFSLLILSYAAHSGRYGSYEKQAVTQEFCGKAGDLAVASRTYPDLGRQRMSEFADNPNKTARAWSEAIQRGLEAPESISDKDLYMRGWSACMDIMR